MADLVQVVDDWIKFKNQSVKTDIKDEIPINKVTMIDRTNHAVYTTCVNCNFGITYSDKEYDNKTILTCPKCKHEFYANPITKNLK